MKGLLTGAWVDASLGSPPAVVAATAVVCGMADNANMEVVDQSSARTFDVNNMRR